MKKNKDIKYKKVRSQLLFTMIIVILLPVAILGTASYMKAFNVLDNKLALTTEQTTREVKESLSEYMGGIENQLSALAVNSIVKALAEGEDSSDNLSIDPSIKAIELLENFNNNNDTVISTYIANEKGEIYKYPKVVKLNGYDPRTEAWYLTAKANPNQVSWSEPNINTITGNITISVTKAIVQNGETVGVIGFDVEMDLMAKKLINITLGREGFIVLATSEGIFMSHPEESLIGTDVLTQQALWQEVSNNDSGFARYEYEGNKRFTSYVTDERTGWKILGIMNEKELVNDTKALRDYIIMGGFIAIVLASIIAIAIARGIAVPLNHIKDAFIKASSGDLSVRTDTKRIDEFGELSNSFNDMMENIKVLIMEVKQSAKTVVETSASLTDITSQTSRATNEVALTIGEIAISAGDQARDTEIGAIKVNDLSNKIEEVQQSTDHVFEMSEETNQLSVRGLQTVKLLIEKTLESSEAAEEVGKIVKGVNESSEAISSITQTITSIADQTNLLALNAAIEAARAGDVGRGFAVVAEEIRKLAEQSGKATTEIRQLIEDIQSRAQSAVFAMQDAKEVVQEQNEAVRETEVIFNQISQAIESVKDQVMVVKQSTNEMVTQKEEIVSVIENVSASAEETSASTQQVSAATEEQLASIEEVTHYAGNLEKLAVQLREIIGKFIID